MEFLLLLQKRNQRWIDLLKKEINMNQKRKDRRKKEKTE